LHDDDDHAVSRRSPPRISVLITGNGERLLPSAQAVSFTGVYMADQWYYAHDADKIGPFSGRQPKDLAASGQIVPTDTVWKEGVDNGVLARKVENLFPPAPADDPPVSACDPSATVPSPSEPAARTPYSGNLLPLVQSDPQPKPIRRAQAVVGKGAVLVGQDGSIVQYRKKCTGCGYEDSCWNRMPIRNGLTRVAFFCPKCRKKRDVEIQGSLN
jgi:hypothetical protein